MSLAEYWGTDTQVSNGMTQEWLPWVPDWRHPWIITDGAKLKFVCSFVLYHSHHSVLPKSISLKMDIRTSCVTSCLSAPPNKLQFLSQTLSPPLHCFLSLESPKWVMYTGTLWAGERRNWLADWRHQSWGNAPSLLTEKMTDSECLLGWQTWHPEVGEWRGPEWQTMSQNGDNKQGHANCVTVRTIKGQKGFWGDSRHAVLKEWLKSMSITTFLMYCSKIIAEINKGRFGKKHDDRLAKFILEKKTMQCKHIHPSFQTCFFL